MGRDGLFPLREETLKVADAQKFTRRFFEIFDDIVSDRCYTYLDLVGHKVFQGSFRETWIGERREEILLRHFFSTHNVPLPCQEVFLSISIGSCDTGLDPHILCGSCCGIDMVLIELIDISCRTDLKTPLIFLATGLVGIVIFSAPL